MMKRPVLSCLILAVGMLAGGCAGNDGSRGASATSLEPREEKLAEIDQAVEQAVETISEENADAELERLKRELGVK